MVYLIFVFNSEMAKMIVSLRDTSNIPFQVPLSCIMEHSCHFEVAQAQWHKNYTVIQHFNAK